MNLTSNDWMFIVELFTNGLEKSLLNDLIDHPNDKTTRSAYADLLEENGRTRSANNVRAGYTPGLIMVINPSAVLQMEGVMPLPDHEIERIRAEFENDYQGPENFGGLFIPPQ